MTLAHYNLCLPGSSDSCESAFRGARTTRVHHHSWLCVVCVCARVCGGVHVHAHTLWLHGFLMIASSGTLLPLFTQASIPQVSERQLMPGTLPTGVNKTPPEKNRWRAGSKTRLRNPILHQWGKGGEDSKLVKGEELPEKERKEQEGKPRRYKTLGPGNKNMT